MIHMTNMMQAYINRQPEALESILQQSAAVAAPFVKQFAAKPIKGVLLAGAGSSCHALMMAAPLGRAALQMPVTAGTPAAWAWLDNRFASETLVIVASQSGTSTNTLALVKRLKDLGYPVCGITQNPASPIAQAVDCHVTLLIPEEKTGPKTMGVMGTVLTAQLMLAALGLARGTFAREQMDALTAGLCLVVSHMPGNIEATRVWMQAHLDTLSKDEAYFVVGQGDTKAVADESGLKLVETIRVPVTVYELEEIIHGPLLAFSPHVALVYLGTPWEEAKRPAALCGLCLERGGRVYRVGLDKDKAGVQNGDLMLRTANDPLLAAYELLIPGQMISAYLAPERGVDLDGRKRHPLELVMAGHL